MCVSVRCARAIRVFCPGGCERGLREALLRAAAEWAAAGGEGLVQPSGRRAHTRPARRGGGAAGADPRLLLHQVKDPALFMLIFTPVQAMRSTTNLPDFLLWSDVQ